MSYFFRDKNNQYAKKILDVQKEIYQQSNDMITKRIGGDCPKTRVKLQCK